MSNLKKKIQKFFCSKTLIFEVIQKIFFKHRKKIFKKTKQKYFTQISCFVQKYLTVAE
jgi:hypothetical protein